MSKALLGTSKINQICFVVHDIEKAAESFGRLLGVPKPSWFLTGDSSISKIVFNGEPTGARNKLIFMDTPSVQIELIEPDQEPSTMREFLNKQEGIHHVAVDVDDMKQQLAILGEAGYPVVQTGEFTSSQGRYAYVDTVPACKTMFELLERDEPQAIPPVKPKTEEHQPLLGSDTVVQIAVVVRDLDAAAEAYCSLLGVEKPTVLKEGKPEVTQVVYRGESTEAKCRFMFIKTPLIEIELIEPGDSPSTWKEHLDTKGESVHHIAFLVKNLDEKVAELEAMGYPLIQKGYFFTGNGKYAYMDTVSDYHVIIELLERF
ncbi:VOC family protein [Brevibacillus invocatus]|uniref:VOC family protein n=1 Tax=Brevibacillus invocatus TaxID=173959 RepID=UPI00204001E0|nr:VOC family protein [Brevibacillus invocatus]MCM3080588.1 VOC family protein [Brevibacillus invocatus]MCM3430795.1 VOC family protein [Brevibacillus invocatus]